MDVDEDVDFDEHEEFLNEIVRRRNIARRTNWRLRSTALTQRDVAIATSIRSSISLYITLLFLVSYQIYLLNQMINQNNNRQSHFFGRLLKVFKYYKGCTGGKTVLCMVRRSSRRCSS